MNKRKARLKNSAVLFVLCETKATTCYAGGKGKA